MSNEPTAKRRGRPAGSNSFVKVKIADLISLIGNNGAVPVSKVWLREMGVAVAEVAPIQIAAAVEPVAEEEKISFSLTTFDDENDEE
jgi:hypothetical protein